MIGPPGLRLGRWLGFMAALGVALRLATVVWVPTVPVSDAWSYYQRAANLVDHGR
jgi:hypothetical protein